jgi:hypothetical protein
MPWTWGTWYFPESELRLLLNIDLFAKSPDAQKALESIDKLRAEMAKPSPAPAAVHSTANEAAEKLDRLANRIARAPFDAATIDALLAREADEHFQPADWDEAAQRFLTLEALWKAHQFARTSDATGEAAAAIAADLEQIRQRLEFPRPSKEKVVGPDGKPALARIDSPTGFDPKAVAGQFASAAAQIRKVLSAKEHP